MNVQCDSCGHKYRMPDRLAGETVPCKECGADIEVPGRRRPRGPARASSSSGVFSENKIWIALGASVVVLLVGTVLILRARHAVPVAQNNPAVPPNNPVPGLPLANPGLPRVNNGNAETPNAAVIPEVSLPARMPTQPTPTPAPVQNVNRPSDNASSSVNNNKRVGFAPSQPTSSEIESLLRKRDGKPIDE